MSIVPRKGGYGDLETIYSVVLNVLTVFDSLGLRSVINVNAKT